MTHFVARPEHGFAWVTGASSGIGEAVALKLASEGFTVVLTARNHQKLVELANAFRGPGKLIVLDGDVTKPDDMEGVISAIEYEHGTLALVVLCAGTYVPVHGEDLKRRDFEETFAVNVGGVVNCVVPAVAHMKRQGRGQIAIVASATAYGGLPTSAAYGASKAALNNMAESLKFDLDKLGIRIQIINPGFVQTPLTDKNTFSMISVISSEKAAEEIVDGLKSTRFEITFPRRLTYVVKALKFLPYSAYFWLIGAVTGWTKKPLRPPEQ